jgi:hypothetical protein
VGTCLECFGRIIACVDRIAVLARVRKELTAVGFDGTEVQGAISIFYEFAVLPLNNALGAFWVGCCCSVSKAPDRAGGCGRARTVGDGAVVGLLKIAVCSEGVADSCVLGLSEAVVDGIVEALRLLAVVVGSQAVLGRERNVYTASHGRVGLAAPCANEVCGNGLRLRHEGGAREQQCGFERHHVAWAWRACESVCVSVYGRVRVYGGRSCQRRGGSGSGGCGGCVDVWVCGW